MSEEFTNIKLVNQPPDLKVKLYPHQLASIYRMEEFESNNSDTRAWLLELRKKRAENEKPETDTKKNTKKNSKK